MEPLAEPDSRLSVNSSENVLKKSILCRRYPVHGSALLAKKLLSCLVDGTQGTAFVI